DAACTIAARDVSGNVVTMSTDASGNARSAELRIGTYYVKETSPSRGYTLDATAHAATISTGDASVTSYESPVTGFVVLNKRSGSTSVTSGNPNYSLAGAVYGVYTDGACNTIARDTSGNAVYLTTDANGNTQSSGKLRLGTYYMKEISASPGYMLDSTVYPVSLTTGTVTVTVNEQPRTDPMNMVKVDQDTYDPATWSLSNNKPQGSATLEGAEFTVMYYYDHYDSVDDIVEAASANGEYETTVEALKSSAVRTWVFKTDSRGYARVSDAYFAGGDELYRSFDGSATIPIGTVVVFESKAPRGYNLPEDVYHITWITISETAKPFISDDKVVENHIEGLKRDIDDKAPIADTEFTLWRLKAEHVAIDDGNVLTVNDDADLDDMANWEKIAALFTDAHGLADFGNLPIGYYRMLETHPPASGEYMSDGETREGGSATKALYPVYFTIDSTTSDSVQVIENRKIQIETTVEKTTITITSIGFAYKDEKGAERDNTGTEKMRYDVGYSSGNSNTYADEYWVYDHCDFAASPYDLRITDIYLPVCEGDTDGMLWLLVR
ncbi:MAG: hypothetical protein IJI15_08215, partial [Atopobiaceae bacterium]|nr:hypothetical protein [Atopobiaceae bacterium]